MDDGGGEDHNIKASACASTDKQVSFTPQIKVVNPDHGSSSLPDVDTNLRGIKHGSDNISDSSNTRSSSSLNSSDDDDDDEVHVKPRVPSQVEVELPQFEVQNGIPESNGDTDSVMDNGGGEDHNIKASACASTDKQVSFTPQIKVVNPDHGSSSLPDVDTNLRGVKHGSDNISNSSNTCISSSSNSSNDDDDDEVHVKPQVPPQVEVELPQFEVQNGIHESNGGTDSVMDNGGGEDQNIKASACASTDKQVSFSPQIKVVNPDHGSGCSPDVDTNLRGVKHGSDNISNSSNTCTSSSSNSSDDDDDDEVHVKPQVPPQVEVELPQFEVQNGIPESNADTELSLKNDLVDNMSDISHKLEEPITEGWESTLPRVDITHETSLPDISPMLSPSIQKMERHKQGSDPHCLTGSMSGQSTPSKKMGWSAASVDSLFSIKLANASFPRDPAPRMVVDHFSKLEGPHKSGDLFASRELYPFQNSEELPKFTEPCYSGESSKPMESSEGSDVSIRGKLTSFSQLSSKSEGGEPVDHGEKGLEYVQLKDTSEAASSPTSRPARIGTNAQTSAHPMKKKKKKPLCPLCQPCFCQAPCCCKFSCKCFTWLSCFRSCFSGKSSCSSKCSAPLCKCFTWSVCCPKNCFRWKGCFCMPSRKCLWTCRC